jgi:hypothetical protein
VVCECLGPVEGNRKIWYHELLATMLEQSATARALDHVLLDRTSVKEGQQKYSHQRAQAATATVLLEGLSDILVMERTDDA